MIQIINWRSDNRQEWLKQRQEIQGIGNENCRVGASDISVLTGSNPWTSKRRLFLNMTGVYNRSFRNHKTFQGQDMEPIVARRFEHYNTDEEVYFDNLELGVKERKLKKAEFFIINPKYPNLYASLDYVPDGLQFSPFTGELYPINTPIEIKYIDNFVYSDWGGQIPMHYYEQLTVQMGSSGTELGVFVPMTTDGLVRPVEVTLDKTLLEYLQDEAGRFAVDVTQGKLIQTKIQLSTDDSEINELEMMFEELTPIDSMTDTTDVLNERKIESIDELYLQVKEGSDEYENMYGYLQCIEEEKRIKEIKNGHKNLLIRSADGFSGIESDRYKCIVRGDNHASKGKYFRVMEK